MVEWRMLTDEDVSCGPQRQLKYSLYWCESGSLSMMIDEDEYHPGPNQVITITSGQAHVVRQFSGNIAVLDFTLDFICKDDFDIELIFHNGLFCHFGMNEIISLAHGEKFGGIMRTIAAELEHQPYQYLISIRSHILLLLVELNRSKVGSGADIWKPDALFLKFLEKVRASFGESYSLADYAGLLDTTEAKLNEQSKVHAGKTAAAVIHGLVVSEAKRLLTYDHLSVKEVAYRLGFNDPFYFSNFFKKHTRLSPKSYQVQHEL
jgi:AraC family transcriptional regulator, transcriptional activator of pobA